MARLSDISARGLELEAATQWLYRRMSSLLWKEKCETDKFVNVDLFMAGKLQKDSYLARRSELTRLAERIEADMLVAKKKLNEMETAADDEMEAALGTMKRFAGEEQLSKAMVQELIEKVLVTDPEHVEIVWKFSDEVRKFIGV